MRISLRYGRDRVFDWDAPDEHVVRVHTGPAACADVTQTVQAALAKPLEFPRLAQSLVPGDKVVIVLERDLVDGPVLIAAVWQELAAATIRPEDVLVLQPASWQSGAVDDPRRLLPADVAAAVGWKLHDPTNESACGYLASSAAGERIYLARELLDADAVIPISAAGYDAVTGFRGPLHVLYPGLSTTAAIAKSIGQGHRELRPEDERPLRQLIEEAGWLLGIQFAVQILPANDGGCADVLAGSLDAVARRAQKQLDRLWRVRLPERVDTMIAAVPTRDRPCTWDDLGAAAEAARSLVVNGGRMILLSDLSLPLGPGMDMIRGRESPRAALQPLRDQAPVDLLPAVRFATAADWATVYLLSQLNVDLVEDLFLIPLSQTSELQRLLQSVDSLVVLSGAQHAYGEIAE